MKKPKNSNIKKRRIKLKKLIAFFTALLVLLGTVIGYFPSLIHAASTTISYATENKVYNRKYSYTFKTTSKTTSSLWGAKNSTSLMNKIDPNNEVSNNRYYVDLTSASKGSFGILYENVGNYNKQSLDLKLTIMDWGNEKQWKVTADGSMGNPTVILYKNKIDVGICGPEWIRTKFTFLKSGTNQEVDLKGHMTLVDLDENQKVRFPSNCGISQAFILKGNTHLTADGNKIVAADAGTADEDTKSWVTALYDANNFYLDFYINGSRVTNQGSNYYPYRRNGNQRIVSDHYGFLGYALGRFNPEKPQKRVGNLGETWENAKDHKAATESKPYLIPGSMGKNQFTYIIAQEVLPNRFSSFTVTDTLKDCLTYVNAKVTNDSGTNVSSQFEITQSGQKIQISAKKEYLEKDNFTNNVIYYFHITVKRNTDKEMEKTSGDMHLVSNTAKTEFIFADGDKEKLSQNTETVWSGYNMTPIPDTTELSKRVGEKGAGWEDAEACDTPESAYIIHEYESFDYLIKCPLDMENNEVRAFRLQDTLEECLDIDNVNKIRITDKDNKTVTSAFEIDIAEDRNTKKTITCTAKEEALEDTHFWTGQSYTLHMTVHRKRNNDVKTSMKEWIGTDGYTFCIPNIATSYIQGAMKGDEVTKDSNISYVKGRIPCELEIDKTCIPYDSWQVGSEVEYAVRVTQTRQDGYAVNVEAWDHDLPMGLKLVPSSVQVTDSMLSQGTVANVKPDGTNGWKATCPRMQYGEYFVVSFRAKADETVNGMDTINTAYAAAENFIGENEESLTVSDSAEVWINTPNLTIDKYMDRYEHEVGDVVHYTVVVNNIADYTVAENVVVSDLSLPKGLRLRTEEGGVKVSFSPDSAMTSVGWPTADGTQRIQCQNIENTVDVTGTEKNTWTVKSKYLSSNTSMTIEFTCEATEAINGTEIVNQASVVADNSPKDKNGHPIASWDDGKIYVNTVDLTIDKNVSKYEWQLDDSVEYQITVSNKDSMEGTIARNIRIEDIEIPEGLSLEDISKVQVNEVPATILDCIAGPQDVPNQLDEQFYNSTLEKDNSYTITSSERGFMVSIPNLPQGAQAVITFPCKATKVAEGTDGWEWINKASVTADNQRGHQPKEDEAELYINTANLTIEKTLYNACYHPDTEEDDHRESNEFRVGEDVLYQLTVQNIQRNSVARNVVIRDVTLPKGYALAGEVTVEGFENSWNNPIAGTSDTANQLDENHYRETESLDFTYHIDYLEMEDGSQGFTVTMENLPCTTGDLLNPAWNHPIVISYHCVASDEVNGAKIVNTASITADNAREKKSSQTVWINSPKLQIEKSSDRKNYKVGDVITYEVTANQNQIGTLARNVFFEDHLLTPGMKLQKNSIVLMDETGAVIDHNQYNLEITNDYFVLNTHFPMVCPDGNYPLIDLDNQKQIIDGSSLQPLGIVKQTKLTLEYQVIVVSDELAGKYTENKITINSDERLPDEDDHKVSINGPFLNIEKTSDKEFYHVGETGIYKLIITQLREEVSAENIQIQDSLDMEGVKIVPNSLRVELNNEPIEPISQEVSDRSFSIATGKHLTDQDKIQVVYGVLFESPALNNQKVRNMAIAWGDNTPKEQQENVVHVTDLNPKLTVEKTSDKTQYKIGDVGHYTVIVRQTAENAVARNVVIKDALQIAGARILPATIAIHNSLNTLLERPEIDASENNYTIHTGINLSYDDYLMVTYDVLFEDDSLCGKDILNIARATADNAVAETHNNVTAPVNAGNGLYALKSCEPDNNSVVSNGAAITYHITIKNTSTEEKTVLVKDKIPEHAEFLRFMGQPKDAVFTDVMALEENVTGQLKKIDGADYAAFVIEKLPAGASKTLSFLITVKDAREDDMIVNLAQVRETVAHVEDFTEETWKSNRFHSTNETVHFLDTQWAFDTNLVTVPAPGLEIQKASDKTSYNVGDTGVYTLKVRQTKDGSVAKNVMISDSLITKGAEIGAKSIKVSGPDGKKLKDIKITQDETSFQIETGMDLNFDETITVTYEVLFKDKKLEGNQVLNTAFVKDNDTKPGEEPEASHEVTVGKAQLAIEKTSDSYEYKLGDTAKYTLTVSVASKEQQARNVVITDVLHNEYVQLDTGSILIQDGEGQKLKNAQMITEDGRFTIQTNTDLAYGETFIVTYKALLKNPQLAGSKVKNTATAAGDNTDSVNADNLISVRDHKLPPLTGAPVLNIEKTADKLQVETGETVHYTVKVTQTAENKQAEFVSISDSFNVNGFTEIKEDSISLKINGKSIIPVEVKQKGATLTVKTGYHLAYKDVMTLEYDVTALKKSETDLYNTAIAEAENAEIVTADCALAITDSKTSDDEPKVEEPKDSKDNNSDKSNDSGNSSTYKGGKTSQAAKTGDERPLIAMGILALIGLLGTATGAWIWRKK